MLSLVTHSNFSTPCSLSLLCRPRNRHVAAVCRRCYRRLPSLILALEHTAASSLASERADTVLILKPPTSTPPPTENTVTILLLPPLTSTPPPSERAIAILFLPPSTMPPSERATTIDLDQHLPRIKPKTCFVWMMVDD
jgi:hypothetical protein